MIPHSANLRFGISKIDIKPTWGQECATVSVLDNVKTGSKQSSTYIALLLLQCGAVLKER